MTKKSKNIITKSLDDLKAIDTRILDLSKINSFTDHLVITTGTSSPHISAISKKLYEELKKNKIPIYGYEGKGSKEWILIDLGEIVGVARLRGEQVVARHGLLRRHELLDARHVRGALPSQRRHDPARRVPAPEAPVQRARHGRVAGPSFSDCRAGVDAHQIPY